MSEVKQYVVYWVAEGEVYTTGTSPEDAEKKVKQELEDGYGAFWVGQLDADER